MSFDPSFNLPMTAVRQPMKISMTTRLPVAKATGRHRDSAVRLNFSSLSSPYANHCCVQFVNVQSHSIIDDLKQEIFVYLTAHLVIMRCDRDTSFVSYKIQLALPDFNRIPKLFRHMEINHTLYP